MRLNNLLACLWTAPGPRPPRHLTHSVVPFHPSTLAHSLLQEYSQWPTYPQLYVNGELLGGCDIVLEMQARALGASA